VYGIIGEKWWYIEDFLFHKGGAQLIRQTIRGSASSLAEDNPQPMKSPFELTITMPVNL
jgi:hypothetical protein